MGAWIESLRGGREELERKIVRIAKRKARAVRGVDDASMLDAELIQAPFPRFKPVGGIGYDLRLGNGVGQPLCPCADRDALHEHRPGRSECKTQYK